MLNRKSKLARAAIVAFACVSTFGGLVQASTTTAVTSSSMSSNSTPSADQLADTFSASVGSRTDAATLIEGMRAGKDVRMADVTVSGTGKTMGYGNVNIALSLAKADAGATATTKGFLSSLDKVMDMRASGMGWGQIAKDLGFRLGEVVSGSKTPNSSSKASHSAKSDKSDKPGSVADAGKANGQGHGVAGGQGAGSNGNGGNGNAGGGGNGGGGHK